MDKLQAKTVDQFEEEITEETKRKQLETKIRERFNEVMLFELDWGDWFDVTEYVLGNTDQLKQLRQMVNDMYGTDYYSVHDDPDKIIGQDIRFKEIG